MTRSSMSAHSRMANGCAAGKAVTFTRSSFHTMGSSLLLVVRTAGPFSGSTTLGLANFLAVLEYPPGPLPGPATARNSLPCLPMATSTVLTYPLGRRFLNGLFTVPIVQSAFPCRAMAHSSLPPRIHRFRPGILLSTSKLVSSSIIPVLSTPWPSPRITIL